MRKPLRSSLRETRWWWSFGAAFLGGVLAQNLVRLRPGEMAAFHINGMEAFAIGWILCSGIVWYILTLRGYK